MLCFVHKFRHRKIAIFKMFGAYTLLMDRPLLYNIILEGHFFQEARHRQKFRTFWHLLTKIVLLSFIDASTSMSMIFHIIPTFLIACRRRRSEQKKSRHYLTQNNGPAPAPL